MNENTISLLKECNSGCKMAINSMKQITNYVEDENLRTIITDYTQKHIKYESTLAQLLYENNKTEKEPNPIASGVSWFTTEFKMLINDTNHQVAKIMMDGCNMGIQSISKYINEYNAASNQAHTLANDLIKIEEDFMQELKPFL